MRRVLGGVEARCAFLHACHAQARRTYAENSCLEGLKQSVRLKSKTRKTSCLTFLGDFILQNLPFKRLSWLLGSWVRLRIFKQAQPESLDVHRVLLSVCIPHSLS